MGFKVFKIGIILMDIDWGLYLVWFVKEIEDWGFDLFFFVEYSYILLFCCFFWLGLWLGYIDLFFEMYCWINDQIVVLFMVGVVIDKLIFGILVILVV